MWGKLNSHWKGKPPKPTPPIGKPVVKKGKAYEVHVGDKGGK